MKILKFFVAFFAIFGVSVFAYGYLNENKVIDTLVDYYKRSPSILINNEYKKDVNIDFVKLTDDFVPKNKDDIKNIYYTIIYSGMDDFTFYCDKEYKSCIDDIISVNDDTSLLSQMNNFVNVYNSFKSIKTTYTSSGKITLHVERVYNSENIERIKNKVNEIYDEIIDSNKTKEENIKKIHDYIINNTKYNKDDENKEEITDSSTAIGPFFNGLATCNGYTDAASLLLDKIGVENLRISNSNHIWNLVHLDNKWLHLDLTWDDPINNLDKDLLLHDYYLITTSKLQNTNDEKDKIDHLFDSTIYNFIEK